LIALSSKPNPTLLWVFAFVTVQVGKDSLVSISWYCARQPECEATALLISLQMAATCGYESVSFESDSQTIVKALLYKSPNENE
jgi:ribonuclease HI